MLAGVLLFDVVSIWRVDKSVSEFQPIQVDAVTGATGCTDVDGDGFCAELGFDCDDTDPEVNPNAPELCDGIDNNCNEIIDGGCDGCTDSDGDGYSLEDDLCGEADCDDSDETISPDAEEICDDGIDNDCDGETDAADQTCQDFSTCTDEDDDGFCAEEDDCDDTDMFVNTEVEEICGDNTDNNCNDMVDEDCPCPATLLLGDDTEGLNTLRIFRDETLSKTERGKVLVDLYYLYSPVICRLLNSHPQIKKSGRESLNILVSLLK
jgi:hypothetical protein